MDNVQAGQEAVKSKRKSKREVCSHCNEVADLQCEIQQYTAQIGELNTVLQKINRVKQNLNQRVQNLMTQLDTYLPSCTCFKKVSETGSQKCLEYEDSMNFRKKEKVKARIQNYRHSSESSKHFRCGESLNKLGVQLEGGRVNNEIPLIWESSSKKRSLGTTYITEKRLACQESPMNKWNDQNTSSLCSPTQSEEEKIYKLENQLYDTTRMAMRQNEKIIYLENELEEKELMLRNLSKLTTRRKLSAKKNLEEESSSSDSLEEEGYPKSGKKKFPLNHFQKEYLADQPRRSRRTKAQQSLQKEQYFLSNQHQPQQEAMASRQFTKIPSPQALIQRTHIKKMPSISKTDVYYSNQLRHLDQYSPYQPDQDP